MSKKLLALLCCVLVVLAPLQLTAADAVGILTNSGPVLVDSRQAGFGSAVFAGETVETKAKARAVITGKGRTVSLGENSTVKLDSKILELESGSIVVASSSTVSTAVAGAQIITDPAMPSKFLAKKVGNDLKVVALEGRVFVNDGVQTTPVPATRGLHVDLGSKSSNKYPGARSAGWLSNDDIGILIVVAAGIAAGVTLGVVNALNNSQPATPPGP